MLYLVVFPQIFDRFMHFVARLLKKPFLHIFLPPSQGTKPMGQWERGLFSRAHPAMLSIIRCHKTM